MNHPALTAREKAWSVVFAGIALAFGGLAGCSHSIMSPLSDPPIWSNLTLTATLLSFAGGVALMVLGGRRLNLHPPEEPD
jgi:hypothetical protein